MYTRIWSFFIDCFTNWIKSNYEISNNFTNRSLWSKRIMQCI